MCAVLSGSGKQSTNGLGVGSVTIQLGAGTTGTIGFLNLAAAISPTGNGEQTNAACLLGSISLNLFGSGSVNAQGWFTAALNFLGNSNVTVAGILSAGLNLLGNGNTVTLNTATSTLSLVLNAFGNDNAVGLALGSSTLSGALNIFGNSNKVLLNGSNNATFIGASNLLGNNNTVTLEGFNNSLSNAFSFLGIGNTVTASNILSMAGSILQPGATV